MNTTCDWLDAVKAKLQIKSDYALAKAWGLRTTRLSNYRSRRSFLDEEMVFKIADALDVDAAIILASVEAERAKRPQVKAAWERIARAISAAVFALFFAGFSVFGGSAGTAQAGAFFNDNIHIMRRWVRRLFAVLLLSSLVACGEENIDRNPYGYHYDAISDGGLRVRYSPTNPVKFTANELEVWARWVFACVGVTQEIPMPLIIYIDEPIYRDGVAYGGQAFWKDQGGVIVLYDPAAFVHENIHHALGNSGYDDERNARHDHPAFENCH